MAVKTKKEVQQLNEPINETVLEDTEILEPSDPEATEEKPPAPSPLLEHSAGTKRKRIDH